MGQEEITAPHNKPFCTVAGPFDHLNHLQRLNARNIRDAMHKRHATTYAASSLGQLRQPSAADWQEYLTDLGQRSVLFWDTLRQRGDNSLAHERAGYPLLLKFDHQTLVDGMDLPRPVNYSLLQRLPATRRQPAAASHHHRPPWRPRRRHWWIQTGFGHRREPARRSPHLLHRLQPCPCTRADAGGHRQRPGAIYRSGQ